MENNISSVQTDPKKSAQPDACVTSIIKNQEQETNVVDIFLEKAKTKSKSILSGRLAQEIFKIAKIPPKVQTSLDLDADDLRWTETLYNNPRPDLADKYTPEDTETFTKQFLERKLPPAPELKPFYNIQEAVNLSNKVVQSGKPNYDGLKIEIKSGMNIPAWLFLLKGYKQEEKIAKGIAYGWPLNWTCSPFLSCQTLKNHPTAERQYPLLFKDWYQDQVNKGMLVGPCSREDLPWKNLSTIPLQSVIKDPVEMTRRVCADPTFSPHGLPPGFGSLNQGIPKHYFMGEPYQYNLPRIRDFINDAILVGLDKVMGFKIDWKFAFRQNPLDPADWWLTVYHIEDVGYFLDIRTNFGYRSSGIPQQLESEAISFMLRKIKISKQTAKWFMRTFFDDEIVLADPSIANELYENSLFLHKLLGIRISSSTDHVIPPTRVLLALGIVLDFDLAIIYMPENKLEKLKLTLEHLKGKEIWSRKDLQSCLGLLNHWTEVIPAGRIFLNRMLPAYKQMSSSQNYFQPTPAFRKDLRWWYQLSPHLNFSPMMVLSPCGPKEFIDMDASTGFGLGAINYQKKEFFLLPTPTIITSLPIHCGEMAVLMLVVDTWAGPSIAHIKDCDVGDTFCQKKLDLFSDNQACIAAINFGRAKDEFLAMGTRFVHFNMAIRDASMTLSYVNTKENKFADDLSRNCLKTVDFLLSQGYDKLDLPKERLEQLMAQDL
jgi:hypothetical protein